MLSGGSGTVVLMALSLLAVFLCPKPVLAEPALSCIDAPFNQTGEGDRGRLVELIGLLREDIAGYPSLVTALDSDELRICLSEPLLLEKAYLDPALNLIVLSDDMDEDLMRAVLVHELRHLEQLKRGICPTDDLSMSAYARAALALEADATVVALLVTWEQRMGGDDGPWRALASWGMTADIAERFEAVMDADGDVPKAAAEAFDQWFLSENRYRRYYVAECSHYLDRQDAAHALPSYRQLSDSYLDTLCVLPDGTTYACTEAPLIER